MQDIDVSMLRFLHVTCGSVWLDQWVPMLRNPFFWAPVYVFLLAYFARVFGSRGLMWCLFFLATFVFCDYVSATLIKPLVHRIRPCHEVFNDFVVRELIPCGSGYSFPSTHATNHFGFAAFMILTLRHWYAKVWIPALLWAVLVSYAQLYVAAHYLTDVLGGMILGALTGSLTGLYFNHRFGLLQRTS